MSHSKCSLAVLTELWWPLDGHCQEKRKKETRRINNQQNKKKKRIRNETSSEIKVFCSRATLIVIMKRKYAKKKKENRKATSQIYSNEIRNFIYGKYGLPLVPLYCFINKRKGATTIAHFYCMMCLLVLLSNPYTSIWTDLFFILLLLHPLLVLLLPLTTFWILLKLMLGFILLLLDHILYF